jgi:hypothetical protein
MVENIMIQDQILFRGKLDPEFNITSSSNQWVEGCFAMHPTSEGLYPCIITSNSLGEIFPKFIIPQSLGQYTRKRDDLNNKIFQYDIVRYYLPFSKGNTDSKSFDNWQIGFIDWYQPDLSYAIVLKDRHIRLSNADNDIEVIGNLIDNLDLVDWLDTEGKYYDGL